MITTSCHIVLRRAGEGVLETADATAAHLELAVFLLNVLQYGSG